MCPGGTLRVFFLGWMQPCQLRLAKQFADAGVEISYWTSFGGDKEAERVVRTHHPNAIVKQAKVDTVGPPDVDRTDLPCLGQSLLDELSRDESVVLAMMRRIMPPPSGRSDEHWRVPSTARWWRADDQRNRIHNNTERPTLPETSRS